MLLFFKVFKEPVYTVKINFWGIANITSRQRGVLYQVTASDYEREESDQTADGRRAAEFPDTSDKWTESSTSVIPHLSL